MIGKYAARVGPDDPKGQREPSSFCSSGPCPSGIPGELAKVFKQPDSHAGSISETTVKGAFNGQGV